jgi:hypothetical protein
MRGQPFLVALCVGLASLTASLAPDGEPPAAQAAVSIGYTLEELVKHSRMVVVATALERESVWEEIGGSRRIVTYTRMRIDESVIGKSDKALWVRTLGGAVGRIGQQVSGEAELAIGRPTLLFLTRGSDGSVLVTGAAQGHYLLVKPKKEGDPVRVALSPSLGTVLTPRSSKKVVAGKRLAGKPLGDVLATIRATKTKLDAERNKNKSP